MKNLLDKLSKTHLHIITLLVCTALLLNGDASLSKTIEDVNPLMGEIVNTIQIEEVKEVEPIAEPEVMTAKIKTQKVIMSRGGSLFKQLSERETINKYVREISVRYNMEPELIMSIIVSESDYNPKATTGKCLGLMQVSSRWHKDRAAKLGVTDFYDAYSNILLGVDYLSELQSKYKDMRLVLMLYNMEHTTAINLYKSGKISSYAKTIIARAEEYKKGE